MSRIKMGDSFSLKNIVNKKTCNQIFNNPNIPQSWEVSQGEGVTIGLIDTGYNDHQALKNVVTVNKSVCRSKNNKDKIGHGTFQIGLLHEIAPKAKIVMVQAYTKGTKEDAGTFKRASDIIMDSGVNILCIPFEFNDDNYIVRTSIQKMFYDKKIFIVSHYNDADNKRGSKPAEYEECLSIARYNPDWLQKVSYRNVFVDYMVPTIDLVSLSNTGGYVKAFGDNGGVAWVAGMIALILSKHRKKEGTSPAKTLDDIRRHLDKLTINIYELRNLTHYGLVDVRRELIE